MAIIAAAPGLGQDPAEVYPRLDCVEPDPGDPTKYRAWFGYRSWESITVDIPVGEFNFFNQAPQFREDIGQQATRFNPGNHARAFWTTFDPTDPSPVAWVLNGFRARVALDPAFLCPDPDSGDTTGNVLSIDDALVLDSAGDTTASFTIRLRAGAPPGGVTFDVGTVDGTAHSHDGMNSAVGADYQATSLMDQTIAEGVATYTFDVPVFAAAAAGEFFFVHLSRLRGVGVDLGDWIGIGTIAAAAPVTALSYFTLAPCRLGDTRATNAVPDQEMRTLLAAGQCGIPATARAIAVNLTSVGATAAGDLAAYPAGLDPAAGIVQFAAGQTRANNAVLVLRDGAVDVFPVLAAGNGTVDVVLDVVGYFQ